MMQIRRTLPLVGPNIWANYPVLEAWVDLGPLNESPSNELPGFTARLTSWLPSMIEHRCSEGVRGGFFQRLDEGTWLGHVLEHVTLELQTLAHLPVGYGRTRETSEAGVYRVVIECLDAGFAEKCLLVARELILAAIENRAFDVAGQLRNLREVADKLCLGPSTQAIVTAAKARGIPFVRMSQGNLVQLGYGKAQRRIWAAETAKTCALAESIAQDKELTRQLLSTVGVPMPAGRAASTPEDAWAAAQELGLPVVVKPQDANHGRGVSIRLEDQQAVLSAFDIASREGSGVLVERFVPGTQYRVLVVGGRAIAASGGEAEQVVADGIHSVAELVAHANQDPKRGEGSAQPLTPLVLDEISLEVLRRQGLEETSVAAAGRAILIHHNGDLTVDETDAMHPETAESCVLAAQTVGLDVAGIDLIAEDIGRPLEGQGGAIIEVNASPGLVMHLSPLVGKPRPVGEAIVEHLFPKEETGRIPLVAVSGTNGKTPVVALVAAMLNAAGQAVGQAGSHGLHVGARVLATNDCANAQSTRRLLLNPFIDAMVVEISEISVLREGLAFDSCKVAVVTNLGSGDHLGEQYVDELSLVAKAVRAPVDVVLPDGYAVLNADDPQVVAMAEKCRGQIIYFSQNPNQALLHDHLHQGGRAVVVHEGKILILGNKQREGLLDLGRLGSTMLGLPAQLVENLLAATAACVALGLPTDAIRQGIERNLHQDGIAIYDAEGCLVVLSPARNASALAAWTRSLGQAFPGRATHAVFEVTPDWRPADAQNIGQLARECFATLTLVCPASADPRVANLCQIMEHPCLAQENSLSDAIDRISRNFGSSHSIFVMTSVRSSYDLANAHCRKRNMVRQNLTGLATMGHSR